MKVMESISKMKPKWAYLGLGFDLAQGAPIGFLVFMKLFSGEGQNLSEICSSYRAPIIYI